MTATVQVQAKGQVTIPKEARDELGLRPGDEAIWVRQDDGSWSIWSYERFMDMVQPIMEEAVAFSRKAKRGYKPKWDRR